VGFEHTLKHGEVGIWTRNVQLSGLTLLVACPVLLTRESLLVGWTTLAVVCVLLNGVGGLLVALALKFADALAKSLATCASLVLTTVVTCIVDRQIDFVVAAGCVLCCVGLVQYSLD
jgi:predicted membrane channel-forming protein YqfA (hemolysin III family)